MLKFIRLSLSVAIVSATLVFFQNCGSDVAFDELSDGSIVAVNDTSDSGNDLIVDDSNLLPPPQPLPDPVVVQPPVEQPPAVQPPAEQPPVAVVPPVNNEEPKKDEPKNEQPRPNENRPPYVVNNPPAPHNDRSDDEVDQEDGSGLVYQCVLEGPGKSKKAGYIDSEVLLNGRTPDTICTTRVGCSIIREILDVKEVVSRGSCLNNPHVVRLTAEQIREIVDKLK